MTRNLYDDPAFFEGYRRLNRSIHGLDGAPEWPALDEEHDRPMMSLVAAQR